MNWDTGVSKTFYASLIHDVFYQFSKDARPFIKRREIDREFRSILIRDQFRFAQLYYFFVRLLGWIWWYGGKMISRIVIGILLLVLAVATVVGMAIENASFWTIYNYITILFSVVGGVVLLKQK